MKIHEAIREETVHYNLTTKELLTGLFLAFLLGVYVGASITLVVQTLNP